MATDAPAVPSTRPRSWLLVLLGAVAVAALLVQFWPQLSAQNSAAGGPVPSKPRVQRTKGQASLPDEPLSVHLSTLAQSRASAEDGTRNPFRFQPKPPPPAPAPTEIPRPPVPTEPAAPVEPPAPPIGLKFIGVVEPKPGDRVAAFSDCRYTYRGREGDIIDGQYRLVKIGVESVTIEWVSGKGRTTIRLSGAECVGK